MPSTGARISPIPVVCGRFCAAAGRLRISAEAGFSRSGKVLPFFHATGFSIFGKDAFKSGVRLIDGFQVRFCVDQNSRLIGELIRVPASDHAAIGAVEAARDQGAFEFEQREAGFNIHRSQTVSQAKSRCWGGLQMTDIFEHANGLKPGPACSLGQNSLFRIVSSTFRDPPGGFSGTPTGSNR